MIAGINVWRRKIHGGIFSRGIKYGGIKLWGHIFRGKKFKTLPSSALMWTLRNSKKLVLMFMFSVVHEKLLGFTQFNIFKLRNF